MARRGRGLEILVRDLEIFLADAPVEIKSLDYIAGKMRSCDSLTLCRQISTQFGGELVVIPA